MNQHKFASGIAAYEPENMDFDPDSPLSPDRKFIQYRKNLLSIYPQTCDDCEEGVKEGLMKAKRLAGADNFRRRLAGTRSNREVRRKRTLLENFSSVGGVIYWSAIIGQVALSVIGLLQYGVLLFYKTWCSDGLGLDQESLPGSRLSLEMLKSIACKSETMTTHIIEVMVRLLPDLAKWSLLLSVASLWWNPFFRNMIRGFDTHIHGFIEWYFYQLIFLVTRLIFWYMLGRGALSDLTGSVTMAAHCFVLGFIFFVRWALLTCSLHAS
jgi:hypothetical protein